MDLTIVLDETQAAYLQRQATTRRLSPEQVARDLFGNVLKTLVEEEQWAALNQRRVELIRKARFPGLTAEETQELEQLQAAVDQRLEPMDRQLLAGVEELRQQAERLPDDPGT